MSGNDYHNSDCKWILTENGWDITTEYKNNVINEVINECKIKFRNNSQISCQSSIYKSSRGNRAKILGAQCYDTETMQWIFKELDITQPINRYIPEWMFVEWLERKEDSSES